MAATMNTGTLPRLLQEGVDGSFGNGYKEHDHCYIHMYEVKGSTKNYEVQVLVEDLSPATKKGQGADIDFDQFKQGFTPKFITSTWAKGAIITQEAYEDELYGQFNDSSEFLGRSMRLAMEYDGADLFNLAFTASEVQPDGDGQPLCSASHPASPSGSGTYSNRLQVDAPLSRKALEDMLIMIRRAKSFRGNNINIQGQKVLVEPGNCFEIERILKSALQNDTANNATNAIRSKGMLPGGYIDNPYLSSPNAWFVLTDVPKGLTWFKRKETTFEHDNEFSTKNFRLSVAARWSRGWGDPRAVYGSNGA